MIKSPKTLDEYYQYLKQSKKIRALELQAQERFWKQQEEIRKEKERLQKLAAQDFAPYVKCPYCKKETKLNIYVDIDPPDSCECCGHVYDNLTSPQKYQIFSYCQECNALIFFRDQDS